MDVRRRTHMPSCGLRRPRMRRSLRRTRITNRPRQCGGFEVTRMRSREATLTRLLTCLPSKLILALLARHAVEHTVHDSGFLAAKEVMRDLDIFVDDRARGHVRPSDDFIHAGTKDGAQNAVNARQAPALGQMRANLRV